VLSGATSQGLKRTESGADYSPQLSV